MAKDSLASKTSSSSWLGYAAVGVFAYLLGIITTSPSAMTLSTTLFGHPEDEEDYYYEESSEYSHPISRFLMKPEVTNYSQENVAVMTCIVLLLIIVTIAFEIFKDEMEEEASRNMKPIVNKLFAELTVLGFLSIVVFIVTRAGFFATLSLVLFHDTTTLPAIFDFVHYTIFFVMVLFVFQVFVLVKEAMKLEKIWLEMEKTVQNPDAADNLGEAASDYFDKTLRRKKKRFSKIREMRDLMPVIRKKHSQTDEDMLLYKNLRDEFILERSIEPPFEPAPILTQVGPDFNFGKYLSLCLSQMLIHVVEINVVTWMFAACATVTYYIYGLMVDLDVKILAWSWVCFGWAVYIFNVFFENHLIEVRRAFAKKELFADPSTRESGELRTSFLLDSVLEADEQTYLNHEMSGDKTLPLWTEVNLKQYLEKRPWLVKLLVGGTPNLQQTFYWFDRKAPKLYLFILQANLVFIGIYFAMNILGFLHVMWREGIVVFLSYAILTTLPFLGLVFLKQHLVSVLSQVCCMGSYRRPALVSEVMREEKTAHVVRAFLVIYKMRMFASSDTSDQDFDRTEAALKRQNFDDFEIREVAKTFDAFDPSGDGAISHEEFEDLMKNLGASMQSENIARMIRVLDRDGDGEVSKEEFIDWYAHNAGEENISSHERASYLFGLFDTEDKGELTIGEFKRKLDALNVGFSIDEVGAIVNELDEDNSGTIGLHEFANLLQRYHPEELKKEDDGKKRRRIRIKGFKF